MKFLIDLTSLGKKDTGIENVAKNAALSFISMYRSNNYFLIFDSFIPNEFRDIIKQNNVEFIKLESKSFDKLRFYDLPKTINRVKADYNLFFAFPCPYFANHKNSVTLIHDLTPFDYRKTQTISQSFRWRKMIKKCIKRDKHILTVSDSVKYEISKKFNRADAKRIYPGIVVSSDENDTILQKYKLKKNEYILSVATLGPRKNLNLLLNAYNSLIEDRLISQKLVLVGRQDQNLDVNVDGTDNIIFTDYISNEQLKALYKNAKFYVSTSVYEGFGLPVIEAMKCNCPLLLSNIAAYKEIAGDKANFFISNNEDDLKNQLVNLCKNSLLCPDSDYTKRFTWENYSKNLYKYLNDNEKLLFVHSKNINVADGANERLKQILNKCNKEYNCDEFSISSDCNVVVACLKDLLRYVKYTSSQLTSKDYKRLVLDLKSKKYNYVFFENSLYGNLEKRLKKRFSEINVVTHFHNYEYKFWSDNFKFHHFTKKNFFSTINLRMIEKSEKISANYSDKLLFISKQDMYSIIDKYNVSEKKCDVLVPQIKDKYKVYKKALISSDYFLFYGSKFYANVDAAQFIISKIAPYINNKIFICGEGLKECLWNTCDNVEIFNDGTMLDNLIYNAKAVVFPIFLGSGAKIKTAHALMFGKYIIGTDDSFVGYDVKNAKVQICNTAEEFIEAIKKYDSKQIYWRENRQLYLDKYMLKEQD